MLYSELLAHTDGRATYEQYKEIEAIYMSNEAMTIRQAAILWKRRFAVKNVKPRAKEMREIKQAIRDFQREKEWAERAEEKICERYAEKLLDYDTESWVDRRVIDSLNYQKSREIYSMWESYGNDATIHIIYEDGSECIASGTELVSGDIVPKMQHIAYACYADGWTEYDTYTGCLDDCFGDLSEDSGAEAREQYFDNVEIMFNTEWGKKHKLA